MLIVGVILFLTVGIGLILAELFVPQFLPQLIKGHPKLAIAIALGALAVLGSLLQGPPPTGPSEYPLPSRDSDAYDRQILQPARESCKTLGQLVTVGNETPKIYGGVLW